MFHIDQKNWKKLDEFERGIPTLEVFYGHLTLYISFWNAIDMDQNTQKTRHAALVENFDVIRQQGVLNTWKQLREQYLEYTCIVRIITGRFFMRILLNTTIINHQVQSIQDTYPEFWKLVKQQPWSCFFDGGIYSSRFHGKIEDTGIERRHVYDLFTMHSLKNVISMNIPLSQVPSHIIFVPTWSVFNTLNIWWTRGIIQVYLIIRNPVVPLLLNYHCWLSILVWGQFGASCYLKFEYIPARCSCQQAGAT